MENVLSCMELHEIWYQVLFHIKGILLCGAETKPTGERKEYKVNI